MYSTVRPCETGAYFDPYTLECIGHFFNLILNGHRHKKSKIPYWPLTDFFLVYDSEYSQSALRQFCQFRKLTLQNGIDSDIRQADTITLCCWFTNICRVSIQIRKVDYRYRKKTSLLLIPISNRRTSNGKTSIVHYRTLSFFAFRFKKKRKFAFFLSFQAQNHYRTCSLRYDIV
jgi:hypothetical protein